MEAAHTLQDLADIGSSGMAPSKQEAKRLSRSGMPPSKVKPFAASETGTFGAGQWAGRFLRKADPPEKGPASEMKPMSPATSDKSDNVGRHLATRALTATNTSYFIQKEQQKNSRVAGR